MEPAELYAYLQEQLSESLFTKITTLGTTSPSQAGISLPSLLTQLDGGVYDEVLGAVRKQMGTRAFNVQSAAVVLGRHLAGCTGFCARNSAGNSAKALDPANKATWNRICGEQVGFALKVYSANHADASKHGVTPMNAATGLGSNFFRLANESLRRKTAETLMDTSSGRWSTGVVSILLVQIAVALGRLLHPTPAKEAKAAPAALKMTEDVRVALGAGKATVQQTLSFAKKQRVE